MSAPEPPRDPLASDIGQSLAGREPAFGDRPSIEPASRAEWRAWLEANSESSTGVWLVVRKKGASHDGVTYEEAVEEAVRFNWIDSTTRRMDGSRYMQRFSPRKPGSNWSQSNRERVALLLQRRLLTPRALAAVEAAKTDGSWNRLDDVDNLVVPDDLASALADTEGAADGFSAIAASQRKMALYWIASAKRPETRAKRIAETVRAAAEGRSPVP